MVKCYLPLCGNDINKWNERNCTFIRRRNPSNRATRFGLNWIIVRLLTNSHEKHLDDKNVFATSEVKNGIIIVKLGGPGSSVGIATDYGLDGPGFESRWGARLSARPDRP